MRRFFYSLAAVAGLLCGLAGCHLTSGVCDCDIEEDPCAVRCPWACGNGHAAPVHAAPLPAEGLKVLPNKL